MDAKKRFEKENIKSSKGFPKLESTDKWIAGKSVSLSNKSRDEGCQREFLNRKYWS